MANSGFPEGTRAEVEATGADLQFTKSCSRPEKGRSQGCDYWRNCIFASPTCGNLWDGPGQFIPFRDNGPRNIGYDLTLSEADGKARKQDYKPCHRFMATLHQRAKNQEDTGERIRIVAMEGQQIVYSERVPEEPNSKSGNMKIVERISKLKVPPYERIGQRFATRYEQEIEKLKAKVEEK